MRYEIELKNITKRYDNKTILDNISISLNNEHVYVLIGKNGSGKSTLLNIIAKYDSNYDGVYKLNGLTTAYLLQDDLLFRNLSVKENLLLQCIATNKEYSNTMKEVIEKLGLQNFLNKKIAELSGGEKKKVSIGQVMLKKADIILLDEPTSNIQKEYAKELMDIILEVFENKILVISSHDDLYQGDKIIRIELNDGEIDYGV